MSQANADKPDTSASMTEDQITAKVKSVAEGIAKEQAAIFQKTIDDLSKKVTELNREVKLKNGFAGLEIK